MAPTPLVLFSDGPSLPTGLARITRDLARQIHAEPSLDVQLLQVGWNPRPQGPCDWPVYGLSQLHSETDWGAQEIAEIWQEWFGHDHGVLLSVYDAARVWSLLPLQHAERQLWGYLPMDGVNVQDSLGGPAKEAVQRLDRVLAYGRWGSEALAKIRRPLPYLPHGIDLNLWTLGHRSDDLATASHVIKHKDGSWVLGCVATNQVRKDLGLYFATLAELRRRGEKVRGWLHTDTTVRAWSVPQLVDDFGLGKHVSVSLNLPDEILSAAYSLCGVTFAPGLGEGFGYPIVESLACGTPVVHGDYAGGRELVPANAWRVPPVAERLEGCYAIRRPVLTAGDCANAILRAWDWRKSEEPVCQQYCRGSVEHLGWGRLWPRWRSWLKQGLEGFNG
jgi:glycosyltransferase involved in cell wall biosynthesis